MDESIGSTIGPYPIRGRIGSGGMSTVYEGIDPRTGRSVAVKLMASFLIEDPKFKARFNRELKLLRSFDHPNIVPVLAYGEHGRSPFIVMPYVRAGTLQDRLQRGPLGMLEAARIIGDIAKGLAYAHAKGVVHRDVKPSNILIDEDGTAMLSDFGFASMTEASLTLTGSGMVGTPSFMAPEQCRGEKVDARTDQYALGIVLYRLATGRLPHDGETPLAIALKQINETPTEPRKVNPHVPLVIDEVIQRAMSKDPRDRYTDMATFNAAFQEAMLAAQNNGQDRTAVMQSISEARIRYDRMLRSLRRTFSFRNLRRWPVLLTLLLLLFIFPLGAYAVYNLTNGPTPDAASALAAEATIASLSTAAAAQGGVGMDDSQIQTVVAGTMAVLQSTPSATPMPTQLPGEPTWTPTPSPTVTDTPNPFSSPTRTATGSGGGGFEPSSTPSRTPTNTPIPSNTTIPSATNTPTLIPSSTPTLPPPPTATPIPINPNACKSDPTHILYCTPTPDG